MPTFYKTFKRSANSFDEMVRARKITVDTGLTEEQARAQCRAFNESRTPAQIRKGLKMEYTAMPTRGNPSYTPKIGEYVAWTMRDGNIMAGKVTSVNFGTASVSRVDGGSVRIDVSKLRKATLDDRDLAVGFYTNSKKNPTLTMFDVYKGRKLIDTIPYSGKMTSEEMKRSLVNHDGYDPSIRVRKRRSKRNCSRRTKRNSPMRVKKSKLGTIAIAGAAVAAVWYFFLRKKGLSDPLPIVALRDPSREPGSTGMSYPAREQNRANAVEAAKYLKPGISDAKAKEIADSMMRSGLMRSYAQRVLSVSEWTNLQPFRNVVENLTR